MPTHALRAVLAGLLIVPVATAVAIAQEGGRIDERGSRLLADGVGDRVCLTLAERPAPRLRRCLPSSRPDTIRVRAATSPLCRFGSRFFGIAPAGTRQLNLGGVRTYDGRVLTVKVRVLRIPTRVQAAGGVAFVIRRELGDQGMTLTAYDAERRRLAHRSVGPFGVPFCSEPKTAVPGPG